jgi:hypothetical protein
MIVNNELERMWKEVMIAPVFARKDENYDKPQVE